MTSNLNHWKAWECLLYSCTSFSWSEWKRHFLCNKAL